MLPLYLGHSKSECHQLPFALTLLKKCIYPHAVHFSYLFAVICLESVIYLIAFLKCCDQLLWHSQKGSTKTFLPAVLSTVSPKQFGAWWVLVHSADIIPYKEDILGFNSKLCGFLYSLVMCHAVPCRVGRLLSVRREKGCFGFQVKRRETTTLVSSSPATPRSPGWNLSLIRKTTGRKMAFALLCWQMTAELICCKSITRVRNWLWLI